MHMVDDWIDFAAFFMTTLFGRRCEEFSRVNTPSSSHPASSRRKFNLSVAARLLGRR